MGLHNGGGAAAAVAATAPQVAGRSKSFLHREAHPSMPTLLQGGGAAAGGAGGQRRAGVPQPRAGGAHGGGDQVRFTLAPIGLFTCMHEAGRQAWVFHFRTSSGKIKPPGALPSSAAVPAHVPARHGCPSPHLQAAAPRRRGGGRPAARPRQPGQRAVFCGRLQAPPRPAGRSHQQVRGLLSRACCVSACFLKAYWLPLRAPSSPPKPTTCRPARPAPPAPPAPHPWPAVLPASQRGRQLLQEELHSRGRGGAVPGGRCDGSWTPASLRARGPALGGMRGGSTRTLAHAAPMLSSRRACCRHAATFAGQLPRTVRAHPPAGGYPGGLGPRAGRSARLAGKGRRGPGHPSAAPNPRPLPSLLEPPLLPSLHTPPRSSTSPP